MKRPLLTAAARRIKPIIGIAANGFAARDCCPESSHQVVRRSRAEQAERVIRNALKTNNKNRTFDRAFSLSLRQSHHPEGSPHPDEREKFTLFQSLLP
jgi:hypothetical protein